ncbi:MAG: deoxyhypusine synthase family protein, partial [Planctomycetota bacterium]
IYDIIFDASNLYDTDAFYRKLCRGEEFQRTMSTAEFHYLVGKYLASHQEQSGRPEDSLLVSAYKAGVPIYTSSPGDSSIGMNVAALALEGSKLQIDPTLCVNETAAIVYAAKGSGSSAVVIWGGGSPKNFVLQTEPHIQEVLGLRETGHDYFLQFTDARPDTGGLSGATPSEAMTWGKVDPEKLPDTVVCYVDTTVAMPLIAAYALAKKGSRKHKRLYDRRAALVEELKREYLKGKK